MAKLQTVVTEPHPSLDTELKWVSPKQASEWLQNRHPKQENRHSKTATKKFVRLINLGRFQTTHQGLAFDKSGRLMDGQHRLEAIVKTGKGQWLQLTRGLDDLAFFAMDQNGKPRTVADTTGLDAKSLQPVMYIARDHARRRGGTSKVFKNTDLWSAEDSMIYLRTYYTSADRLWKLKKLHRNTITRAYVRAGALVRAIEDDSFDYLHEQWIPFVTGEAGKMSSCVAGFWGQLLSEKVRTGKGNPHADFLRAYRAFAWENRDLTRTQIRDYKYVSDMVAREITSQLLRCKEFQTEFDARFPDAIPDELLQTA